MKSRLEKFKNYKVSLGTNQLGAGPGDPIDINCHYGCWAQGDENSNEGINEISDCLDTCDELSQA